MEKLCAFLILCSLFIAATNATSTEEAQEAKNWIQTYLSRRNEKPNATLHFYVQDAIGGPNATVWEVARANITSKSITEFGQVRVVDDLITAGPDPNSEKLGRVQGLITSSDLEEVALVVNMNFVFTSGPYKGNTLCILGRSQIHAKYRELIVAGGTGVFQMARGYVNASTYYFDGENYAVLEYEFYLYHP